MNSCHCTQRIGFGFRNGKENLFQIYIENNWTRISPSPEKFDRYQRAILDGTDKDFVFKDPITELPENAKKWVEDNKERIQGWKSEPWFIRDNKELRELVRD